MSETIKLKQQQIDEVIIFINSGIEEIWNEYPDWTHDQKELAGKILRAIKQHIPDEVNHFEELSELEVVDA